MPESKKDQLEDRSTGPAATDELDDENLDGVVGGMVVQTSSPLGGLRVGGGGTKQPQTTTPVFSTGATLDNIRGPS